jgi:hypothetical protein
LQAQRCRLARVLGRQRSYHFTELPCRQALGADTLAAEQLKEIVGTAELDP